MAHNEHRVFHVAEMLEAILCELPQKDLLLSKAVCKLWNKTIEKSIKLQRSLYFMPDGIGRFLVEEDGLICEHPQTPVPQKPVPEPNPLLMAILPALFLGYYELTCHGRSILPKAYAYPQSSWRRMLLTQPAISSLHVYSFWKDLHTNRLDFPINQIVNAGRITIDDWVKCLEEIQRKRGKRYKLSRSYIICELWDPALSNEVLPLPMSFGRDWTCS